MKYLLFDNMIKMSIKFVVRIHSQWNKRDVPI